MAQEHDSGLESQNQTRKYAEPYSPYRPIPRVDGFLHEQAQYTDRRKEGHKTINYVKSWKNAEDKNPPDEKSARRTVRDPVTKSNVTIQDTGIDPWKAVSEPSIIVPKSNIKHGKTRDGQVDLSDDAGIPSGRGVHYRKSQDALSPPEADRLKTADMPIQDEVTNILFYSYPDVNMDYLISKLESRNVALCTSIFLIIVAIFALVGNDFARILNMVIAVCGSIWLWGKDIEHEVDVLKWETERERGESAVLNLIPESAEWLNSLVKVIWPLLDPEKFAAIADTLEDVMQASVPSFVDNVQIADIGQGLNPPRVLSIRSLPDSDIENMTRAHEERLLEEDPSGTFYNLECALAYHSLPANCSGISAKAKNLHIRITFYLAVWIEIISFVATVRMRFQMTSDPPFVKNVTFTFMGLPKFQVSAVPITEHGFNVLDLPLITTFVNNSIETAANEYVAPRSMSLKLKKMLQGDDIKKDTDALGVLLIIIKYAINLSKQDRRGSNDAYITLSFSKYGKIMYSTRVIIDDFNPIWEESTCLLVFPDNLKSQEEVSVQLWDSDRFTADDMVGKVNIELHKLVAHAGKFYERNDKLYGEDEGSSMPGRLAWAVGYFPKVDFNPARTTSGRDLMLPQNLQDHPKLQDEVGVLDNQEETYVTCIPPDPEYPTGIFSIIVHQIVNMGFEDIKGSYTHRSSYLPGQSSGEGIDEEGARLPSAYVTIILNDTLIFRTRTKVVTSKPIYNAGTEKYIRDWRNTIVCVAVRDERRREHDPLLGFIHLALPDVFQTRSELTRWYPLEGGIGYGWIRLSILFRSVALKLQPSQLGWDIGTFELLGGKLYTEALEANSGFVKIKIKHGACHFQLSGMHSERLNHGIMWRFKDKMRIPSRSRYRSPVIFEFYKRNRKLTGISVLWLSELVDENIQSLTVPIWRTNKIRRLTTCKITEDTPSNLHQLDLHKNGTLHILCRFTNGIDELHRPDFVNNDDREVMEVYDACASRSLRSETMQKHSNSDTHDYNPINLPGHNIEDGNESFDRSTDRNGRPLEKGSVRANRASENSPSHDREQNPNMVQRMKNYRQQKRTLHRRHRGLMQWKAARSIKFIMDELKVGAKNIKRKLQLGGREPDVETEL